MGFWLLQSSSLLVVGSGTVKECILVPRNAFINTLALPIQGFFMEPKKLIKELERHLARIEGRSRTCKNPRTGQSTTIPGQVTQEEQRIVDQISWEITSWHETTKTIAEETKAAKEQIEEMAKQLKRMRDTTDQTEGSVEYAIDSTLCANGLDRKVYHGQCLIGPQIQKLLANRVTILSQLEVNFMRVREQTLERDATTNLASKEEIK
jgi:hypothetical protein